MLLRMRKMVLIKTKKIRDFLFYINHPKKTIVIVLSSMRSGSTLLKALLAECEDVSHLPEVDYRKYFRSNNKYSFYKAVYKLSQKRIICLKAPHWFKDSFRTRRFPKLPEVKIIVLTRDVTGVVQSLKERHKNTEFKNYSSQNLLDYWCNTYENILESVQNINLDICYIRYEDLISAPMENTARLFCFIGSSRISGVDSYNAPKDFTFQYHLGDGSEKIKSLKVQKQNKEINPDIKHLADSSQRVQRLRNIFGYLKSDEFDAEKNILTPLVKLDVK